MTPAPQDRRAVLLRRLHSLTGAVPLGLFFAMHLSLNATALQGSRAFDERVQNVQAWPGLLGLEILGIHLPLLIHVALGALSMVRPGLLADRPGPLRLTRHQAFLQRATGLATLTFLGYHLATLRIPLALGRLAPADLGPILTASLSSTTASGVPARAVLYLLGTGAASYHLALGLSTFGSTWELATSEPAVLRLRVASGLAGATLFTLGALTVLHHATGSTFGLGR